MNSLLNLNNLNLPQMILFIIGCTFWLITYIIYVRNIVKFKFIEIPVIVVALNIAWEFIWSFPLGHLVSDYLGDALQWGYGSWFFFDMFIFWGALKYGYKQFENPTFRKHSKLITIATMFFGLIFFYTFYLGGYDTAIGTISAYIDNILISALYIFLLVDHKDKSVFSYQVAWYKMLGTGLISFSLAWHWSSNYFLIFLTAVVLLLDIAYIIIFSRYRKQTK